MLSQIGSHKAPRIPSATLAIAVDLARRSGSPSSTATRPPSGRGGTYGWSATGAGQARPVLLAGTVAGPRREDPPRAASPPWGSCVRRSCIGGAAYRCTDRGPACRHRSRGPPVPPRALSRRNGQPRRSATRPGRALPLI